MKDGTVKLAESKASEDSVHQTRGDVFRIWWETLAQGTKQDIAINYNCLIIICTIDIND